MKIIKRSKQEVQFDSNKIYSAIKAGNDCVAENDQISDEKIKEITDKITNQCEHLNRVVSVEEVQDMVENELMSMNAFALARHYMTYRYEKSLKRKSNTTDAKILSLIEQKNEEVKEENSNKDTRLNPVMRDYIAGEVSRDITRRLLLPEDVKNAHDEGLIHFHDSDFFVMPETNCCLVNINDMLQNGTVINGVKIDKPHRFLTACTIATQIVQQVSASQYGGQTIYLSDISPFVNESRIRIRQEIIDNSKEAKLNLSNEQIEELTKARVKKEINAGMQTFFYQLNSIFSTNGQTPFVSVYIDLKQVSEGQQRQDLADCTEEMLKQRIQGFKNKDGIWVTPAFPKLLYVLDDINIEKDSPYYYLTKLAAECTAKRMTPDYISAKKMRELKNGDVYACMGCVDGSEVIAYRFNNNLYVESFERMWDRISNYYPVKKQPDGINKYIDTNFSIYDSKTGFTKVSRVIKNHSAKWLNIKFSNGRFLQVTNDHPFETENRGVVKAENLSSDDIICFDKASDFISEKDGYDFNKDRAWLNGVVLCNASYSIAINEEDEIQDKVAEIYKNEYGIETLIINRDHGKDLLLMSDKTNRMCGYYETIFGGNLKTYRHIPNEVFSWNKESRLAFLAGMIDADGYIDSHKDGTIQIESVNKELAIQQMLLAQSVGYFASLYVNNYSSKNSHELRYRVEFVPDEKLLKYIRCTKKKKNFVNHTRKNHSASEFEFGKPVEIIPISKEDFSYDVTTESEHFTVSGVYSHNCRSFLTPWTEEENGKAGNIMNAGDYKEHEHKYKGRFNIGVVTINLPYIALDSGGNEEIFWKKLDDGLAIAKKALDCRIERLKDVPASVSPVLWEYGALARLQPDEKISKLFYHNNCTISLGYCGIYEMTKYMTGVSHTQPKGHDFAIKVMKHLNDTCTKWRKESGISFSLYGTPLESTTYKFAKCLQKKFGIIPGITDRNYITNSYHVPVFEEINAFDKITIEAPFAELSPGGQISYTELPNMQGNIQALLALMKHMYNSIIYTEVNGKMDYCENCGNNVIPMEIYNDGGKLKWRCPVCGCTDDSKLYITRRTCGYIGTQRWNQGRTQEIKDRVLHL